MYLKKNGKRMEVHTADMAEAYKKLGWQEFAAPVPESKPPDLASLSKPELLDLAKQQGIEVPMGAKKADLLTLLEG